jgi:hypothetical protein
MAQALPRVAQALDEAGVPFCVAGGMACWFHGGPEPAHDLDLLIRPDDALAAAGGLEAHGLAVTVSSADWLFHAWEGEPWDDEALMVDLLYAPIGVQADDETLARARLMRALGTKVLVMDPTDIMIMRLLALREQSLSMAKSLAAARAMGASIDWRRLRESTRRSPYADAFLRLAANLGLTAPIPLNEDGFDYESYERERSERAERLLGVREALIRAHPPQAQ